MFNCSLFKWFQGNFSMIQVSLCKTLAEFFKYMIANAYEIPKISFLQIFSHRYQTLTLPEEGSSSCMFVNGTLVHRCKEETPKCEAVRFREKKTTTNLSNLHFRFLWSWLCFVFCPLRCSLPKSTILGNQWSCRNLPRLSPSGRSRPSSCCFASLNMSEDYKRQIFSKKDKNGAINTAKQESR